MKSRTMRGSYVCVLLACTRVTLAGVDVSYPANPAIVDDAVYVSAQGVNRLDARTLTPIWRALDGVDTLEPVVTPVAVLVASSAGLHALDPVTGTQRWQLRSQQGVFPPAVSAGVAYVGGRGGSLRALALADGKVLWRHDYGGWLYTPAVIGEHLIVGGQERVLRALETRSGKLRWQKQLTQELVYRPVAVAGERVVVTLFDGTILMIDASDGHTLWQIRESTPNFPPAVSAGTLYFGSFHGKLHARAVANGRMLWQRRLGGRLHLLPQLVNAAVLIANDQGQIGAYQAATGRKLWTGLAARELVASPVVLNDKVLAFIAGGAHRSWPVSFIASSKHNLPGSATQ